MLVTLAGPGLVDGRGVSWWFVVRFPLGNAVALYLGMGAMSVAWLGLGRRLAYLPRPSVFELRAVGAVWCLPLLVAPALFSRDVYSYLAQGTILHLGLSPYHNAPVVLAHLGHAHLLDAVSPFWRGTTAPYGPLFLGLVSPIAGAIGSNLIVGVLLLRLLEVAGVVLLAIFVPRLAQALGADPARALWLALLSPLVLLELVGAAHNDALMAGLMVAGVTLAIERRPLAGIALCALAAAIKLPAAAAALFIAVSWARASQPTMLGRARALAQGASAAAAVLLVVSAATGVGFSWLSTSLFSTPQRVQLAITPATGLGWTIAALLHDLGIGASSRHIESALSVVALVSTGLAGAILLWRARPTSMVRALGWLLLAAALGGPAAWPWYLSWGLVLLAADPSAQRLPALAVAVLVSVFLVKANGILALPLQSAPAVLAVYIAAGGAAGYAWRRQRADDRRHRGRVGDFAAGAPSALAES